MNDFPQHTSVRDRGAEGADCLTCSPAACNSDSQNTCFRQTSIKKTTQAHMSLKILQGLVVSEPHLAPVTINALALLSGSAEP